MLKAGKELINEIKAARPVAASIDLWWLGQHSFVIKTAAGTIIYIDPFLSDHGKRLIPSLLEPEMINHADLVIGTHDHRDHIDREIWPAMARTSTKALFMVPEYHRDKLINELPLAAGRLHGLNAGEEFVFNDLKITAIASAHEFLERDETSGLYPFLGFVYELEGITLYHPGDCCIYDGLYSTLSSFDIDIALLPINGRDARRLKANCIGNMTFQEAADLAGFLEVKTVIPSHFDMFPGNREDPGEFSAYVQEKYPLIKVCIARYGEKISLL